MKNVPFKFTVENEILFIERDPVNGQNEALIEVAFYKEGQESAHLLRITESEFERYCEEYDKLPTVKNCFSRRISFDQFKGIYFRDDLREVLFEYVNNEILNQKAVTSLEKLQSRYEQLMREFDYSESTRRRLEFMLEFAVREINDAKMNQTEYIIKSQA